jgi:photosystem II stability/assembly factor-like uncharacterized protein
MPGVRDDGLVAVGTAKGVFLLRGAGVRGPYFPGDRVPSFAIDARVDPPRLYAGTVNDHWGPVVRTSDDRGDTWSEPDERTLRFPPDTGDAVAQVWQLQPAGADRPETIFAGVEPANLFRSDDAGESWTLVRSLWEYPHRDQWEPGGGGLGLHSILVDPRDSNRVAIAISAGGVYRTDDNGVSWTACNTGIHKASEPGVFAEHGQCVHKIARDPVDPDRLYAQNHGGLYRSDNNGDSWTEVSEGVPSDFGFPIVAHPRRPNTAYVIPLASDNYRCTVDAQCRVFRTTDAGATWEALSDGLPSHDAHLTVLRDGFCTDGADPAGLYFGTRTGQVYGSSDEGEHWSLLAEYLPPVLCVRAWAP